MFKPGDKINAYFVRHDSYEILGAFVSQGEVIRAHNQIVWILFADNNIIPMHEKQCEKITNVIDIKMN